MTPFPATELDADGQPVAIAAVWQDPAEAIDPPEDDPNMRALELAQNAIAVLQEACTTGLDRVPDEKTAAAVGMRFLGFLVRHGRQPFGCTDQAALARRLKVTKNAVWQGGEKVSNLLKQSTS